MGTAALLPEGASGGEGAVVDDGLVVVLDDNLIHGVSLYVPAVDFGPGVLPLAEGTDVEIVIQDPLDGDDGPGWLYRPAAFLAGSLPAQLLRHPGCGDLLGGEVVGNLFVAPAVVVVGEDLPHDVRLGRYHLKLLLLVEQVAVGGGAQPLAVLLAAADHGARLFAGVGDRHLVDEELELDLQPVVIVGEIDVVSDGDDPDPRVPQVLQFHQTPAVAPGKAGEILDDEDVVAVGHEPTSHGLVALPLLEGVAGAVPVLIEGEGAAGELAFDKVLNNGLLVFNGSVVPVQLLIHGDAAVARNIKPFCQ